MNYLTPEQAQRLLRLRRICFTIFDSATNRDKERMFELIKTSFNVLYRAGFSEYEAMKHAVFNHMSDEKSRLVTEAKSAVRISLISKYSILQKND